MINNTKWTFRELWNLNSILTLEGLWFLEVERGMGIKEKGLSREYTLNVGRPKDLKSHLK